MKRLLFLLIMCLPMMAGAQEMEILDSIRYAPDPMYDNVGKTIYQSKHMVFILSDAGTLEWKLINPPHIFINSRSKLTGQNLGYSNVRVGLFAENDSLLAMVDKWKAITSEHGQILTLVATATFKRPNGEKMDGGSPTVFATLLKRKGSYVRVVAETYNDYLFEVKARLR